MASRAPDAPPANGVQSSTSACAGAAAAFVLRLLGMKSGVASSGSAERLLWELTLPSSGSSVESLARWFRNYGDHLQHLGYRVVARRVAFRTSWLLDWVGKGNGFRAAVLQTDRARLLGERPRTQRADLSHAVALTALERGRKSELALIDPWPGEDPVRKPPPTLESAHRAAKYGCVVIHWSGWS